MNFGELTRVWRRRKLLTAWLVCMALLGVLAASARLPRTYQSEATVVLLASRAAARANGGNPYLSFTPSLSLAADALSRDLVAPATVSQLAGRGFPDAYTVAPPTYATPTSGSVLLVTVTGSDPASVQRTLLGVIAESGTALAAIQGKVRRADQIRVATLSASPRAQLSAAKTARPLVAIAVLGLLAALWLPVLVDGRIARRRARRQPGGEVPDQRDGRGDRPARSWGDLTVG